MSNQSIFVDRKSDLQRLRSGLESGGNFYTVVGPSGYGKSALLNEFAQESRRKEIPVVGYEIREPESVLVFLQRFLEQWSNVFPGTVLERLQETVSEDTIEGLMSASSTIDPSGGIGSAAVGALFGRIFRTEDIAGEIDPLSFMLDVIDSDAGQHDVIVVIVESYEPSRFGEELSERFDSKFREISSSLPENVVWCLETSREIPLSSSDIYRVHLDELGLQDVKELISKRVGFSPDEDTIGEVFNRTKGHPYFLNQLLSIANENGLEKALLESPTASAEFNDYIERNVLDRIGAEREQFLRDICILDRIFPHIAGEVADISSAKSRQILSELHRRAILRKKECAWGDPFYQQHNLQRDYLMENEPRLELRRKRIRATVAYLSHAGEISRSLDAEPERGEILYQKYDEYIGQFDHHLEALIAIHDYEVSELLEELFDGVENPTDCESAIRYHYGSIHSPTEQDSEILVYASEDD